MARRVGSVGEAATERSSRARIALVAAAGAVLLASGGTSPPRLVWNASASSPQGLYSVVRGKPRVGAFAVAWPPDSAARLARARGYLPEGVPLVKTVAAGEGDRVCASGTAVVVGARLVAARRPVDSAGRPLPWWSGCRALARDELWLHGAGDRASFDSRYFGPVRADRVVGPAVLVWPQ